MNKCVLALGALALALPMAARAQTQTPTPSPTPSPTHVALSLLSSRIQTPCESGQRCSPSGRGASLSLDAPLPDALTLDLGGPRLDTIEIAYTEFGHSSVNQSVSKLVFVGRPTPATRRLNDEAKVSPSAIALNLLVHAPLVDDVSAHLRLGVAVVSTVVSYSEAGSSLGSVTENHVRPNLGLGLSWAATPAWALTLDWDATRYASDGWKGPVRSWRLGVQWAP